MIADFYNKISVKQTSTNSSQQISICDKAKHLRARALLSATSPS